MTAGLPSSWAAAHWPISLPASRLSVANVMSTVSAGSGGVSRAMTNRPASRAFLIAALTPGPSGVMRMPFSPCGDGVLDRRDLSPVVALCLAGGDGDLDAELVCAFSLAPFCMATKNGLRRVLVISDTAIGPPAAPEPDAAAEPDAALDAAAEAEPAGVVAPGLLQAPKTMAAVAATASPRSPLPIVDWFTCVSSNVWADSRPVGRAVDNVVCGL